MSRARGKHTPRAPVMDPNSGEGREIGMSDRTDTTQSPIPGGENHITNHPSVRQRVPVPDSPPEHGGLLAHGVPPDKHTFRERAEMERGPNTARGIQPKYLALPKKPAAVPVQVIQGQKLRTLASDVFTVPAAGTEPIRIAGRDYNRTHICLLVETAAGASGAAPTGIRVDHEVSNLDTLKGALIRAGGSSYLKMECNDELFAVSNDGSACTLSVIYLYQVAETG